MMKEDTSYEPLAVKIEAANDKYTELLANKGSDDPEAKHAHQELDTLQKEEKKILKALTKTEKDIIRKTLNRVSTINRDLEDEKERLERLIEDTTNQINAFNTKHGIDPNDKTTSWEQKCEEIITALDEKISSKTAELEAKQQELARLKKEKSALKNPGMLGKREDKDLYKTKLSELNKLSGEIEALQDALKKLNKEKAKVAEMQDLPQKLQEATEKLDAHPEKMEKAQSSAQKQYTAIVQPLEKKAQAIIDLDKAKKSQKTAGSDLTKARKALTTATSKHETAEKKLSKLNDKKILLNSLVDTKTQLVMLKSDLRSGDALTAALTLNNISSDLQKRLEEYDTARKAESDYDTPTLNGKINTEIDKIGTKIGNIEREITAAKTKVTEAETKVTEAETKVTEAETKVTEAETKVSTAETALQEANDAVTKAVDAATKAEAPAPGASEPSPNMFQKAVGHGFRTLGGIVLSAQKAVGKDLETRRLKSKITALAMNNTKFKQLDSSKQSAVQSAVVKAFQKEMRRNPTSTGHEDTAAASAEREKEINRLLEKEITSANTVTIRQGELNFHHQGWTSVTLAQKSIFEQTQSWGVSDIDPDASHEDQIKKLNEEYGTANANDKMAFSISGSEGSQKISTGRMDREAGKAMAKMLVPKENEDGKKPLEFRSGDSNSGMEFLVGAGKQCILDGKPCHLQTHSASSHRNNTLQILNEISQAPRMAVSGQTPPSPEQQVIDKLEHFMQNYSTKKFSPKDSAKFLVDIASSTEGGLAAITKDSATNNPDLEKAIKAEIKSKVFKGNKLKTTKLVLQKGENLRDSKKGLFLKGGNSKRAFMLAAKAMDDPGSRIVENFLSEIKNEIEGAKEHESDPADLKDRVMQIVEGFHESMGLSNSKADMALKTNIAETVNKQIDRDVVTIPTVIPQEDHASKGFLANLMEKASSLLGRNSSEQQPTPEPRLENEHNNEHNNEHSLDATTPSPTGAS